MRSAARRALGLLLFQILVFLLLAGGRYAKLQHWDVVWFKKIAVEGYSVSTPLKQDPTGGDNVAFLPGFPILARGVIAVVSPFFTPETGIYLAGQLAGFVMWFYFVLLLELWAIPAWIGTCACLGLLTQPGAFFLVTGYSEPLLAAALLGYVYWYHRALDRRRPGFFALAALHGFVLSSTKITGLALCGYPVLVAACETYRTRRAELRAWLPAVAVSAVASAGLATYLVYCQLRWGRWDLYWEANRLGWGVQFEWKWLVSLRYYRDVFFFGNLSEILGRLLTLGQFALGLLGLRWALRRLPREKAASPAAPLALLVFGFFVETIVGSHGMHAMVRYLIPIDAVLFLLGALWLQDRTRIARIVPEAIKHPQLAQRVVTQAIFVLLLLMALQALFITRFGRGEWVG